MCASRQKTGKPHQSEGVSLILIQRFPTRSPSQRDGTKIPVCPFRGIHYFFAERSHVAFPSHPSPHLERWPRNPQPTVAAFQVPRSARKLEAMPEPPPPPTPERRPARRAAAVAYRQARHGGASHDAYGVYIRGDNNRCIKGTAYAGGSPYRCAAAAPAPAGSGTLKAVLGLRVHGIAITTLCLASAAIAAATVLACDSSVAAEQSTSGPPPAWPTSPFHGVISGATSEAIPCRCRFQGTAYRLGDTVCMSTPLGVQFARCDLILNNTSWIPTGEPCPMSRLNTPAQAAMHASLGIRRSQRDCRGAKPSRMRPATIRNGSGTASVAPSISPRAGMLISNWPPT